MKGGTVKTFELGGVLRQLSEDGRAWRELLRVDSLSLGVYRLRAGQEDLQQPHTEDEVYYVVSGWAGFEVDGRRQDVGPGTILFVEKRVPHRFVDVTEALVLVVFFAPAEHSLQHG
jgi:mannose-6-phosphate isomerase-like protein (cupin superfamily)